MTNKNSNSLSEPVRPREVKARHPAADALGMFFRNKAATVALFFLTLIILVGIIGPSFYPIDPYDMVWAPFSPPGQEGFIFGTDYLGRDLFAGIIHGTRAVSYTHLTLPTICSV